MSDQFWMPPGEYYIGDPCYVIEEWDDFLGPLWASQYTQFEWKGKQCIGFSTAYGDGCYEDDEGNQYPVDAGIIGAVPIELCDRGGNGSPGDNGSVFTFREKWLAETDGETLRFGSYVIETGDSDERHGDYCEHCGC